MFTLCAFTIKILENINTGSYGEIFNTLVGGQITNSELRLINGYDDGIVLDKDCYTVSYVSRLYSGSSTVNNAGNNQVFEVYSYVEDDTVSWYESSTSLVAIFIVTASSLAKFISNVATVTVPDSQLTVP